MQMSNILMKNKIFAVYNLELRNRVCYQYVSNYKLYLAGKKMNFDFDIFL